MYRAYIFCHEENTASPIILYVLYLDLFFPVLINLMFTSLLPMFRKFLVDFDLVSIFGV